MQLHRSVGEDVLYLQDAETNQNYEYVKTKMLKKPRLPHQVISGKSQEAQK